DPSDDGALSCGFAKIAQSRHGLGWEGDICQVETGDTNTRVLNHAKARRTRRTATLNPARSVKVRTNLTIWSYRKVAYCCHRRPCCGHAMCGADVEPAKEEVGAC